MRRSCQTIALCTGRPVARSHSTVVSRWLVMPIAAIGRPRAAAIASRQVVDDRPPDLLRVVLDPARPRVDLAQFDPRGVMRSCPAASNRIARVLVVPWSIASR